MKIKSIIIISSLVFIGIISYLIYDIVSINNNYVLNDKNSLNTNNYLAIMLETTAGSGEYQESDSSDWPSSDYIFNETLSKCSNGSTLAWDSENNAVIFSGVSVDACYVYFDIVDNISQVCESGDNLASCLKTLGSYNPEYTKIYYHDSNLENGANDNSYRYSGASSEVNNYVCFGSEEDTCPDDNLYRIIGVFDNEVKLVKASSASTDVLGDDSNYYTIGFGYEPTDKLFEIALNTNFLSTFTSVWQNKINMYSYKIDEDMVKSLKIALVSENEYTYAVSKEVWNPSYSGLNWPNVQLNWIYTASGGDSILLERTFDEDDNMEVHYIKPETGFIESVLCGLVSAPIESVLPSFYLNSSIAYLSGVGTSSSPIRIS